MDEDWWKTRHKQKLAELENKQGQVNLLFVGDSIIHDWENHQPIWDQYYQHHHTLNLGFSGDRTEHVLWRLQNGEINRIAPKVTVLMIGTNNTGDRMDSAEHTALGIREIIDELKQRLPTTKILVLGIFPRAKYPHNDIRTRNEAINRRIADFADNERVFYLDINQHFLDKKGILAEKIMPDLVHPNAEGYRIWAAAMEPALQQLLDLP